MLESIWYFILFFALGVFLPIMIVWLLVKLWLHFFGKDRVNEKESRAGRRIEQGKDEIMGSAGSDEERRGIAYFLSHDEAVYPDSEFLPRMRRMREELRSRRIDKPGMEKILDHEAKVVDDGRCLERRLPNAELVSSKYRRTLIFCSAEAVAVETVDADIITGKTGESELILPFGRIVDVSALKWTPPVHVDGRLERGTCWSLKFLLKGGTAKVIKGFPDDPSEIAEELKRRADGAKEIRE